jgi:plastocyanin
LRLAATFAALGIALIGLAAFSFQPNGASADTTIDTGNLYFCSSQFQGGSCTTNITTGETVTWSVSAGFHTVTQCTAGHTQCPIAGGFDSGSLEQGQTFSRTFNDAGAYEYYCAFHPSDMYGIINVTAPTPSPTPVPTTPGETAPPTTAQPGTAQPAAPAKQGGPSDSASSLWLLLAGLGWR